jgi:hypothetical protein
VNQDAPEPAGKQASIPWRLIFRIIRWTTIGGAVLTLALLLHKAPPPAVETSPQAAARVEEKIQQVEQTISSGAPATLRMDETELNSYLAAHLDLAGNSPAPGAQPDIEQVRSAVRDVKVQLLDDSVRAYVVFDFHGKDMTLQLEGALHAANGYLQFVPTSGAIGSLPIPRSTLEDAVRRMMDSPENREKLKLPADLSDLRIEHGEVVVSYQ